MLLYTWLGLPMPQFAHMPLLRNANKSKISKRKNPAARLTWFQEQGYLPEALRNFLALLGYSMPEGQEVFSFDEMVEHFDWQRVNTVGPVFDLDKARLAERPLHPLDRRGRPRGAARPAVAGSTARSATSPPSSSVTSCWPRRRSCRPAWSRLDETTGMLGFLLVGDDGLVVEDDAIGSLRDDAGTVLDAATAALQQLPEWTTSAIEAALRAALVEGLGVKPKLAFGPLRVAVTGRRVSPPLFESMEILGRESSLRRLQALRQRVIA
ncbi:hypothetical protein GCM10025868_40110 [Angustibacter aerolatus]|uniref:Glutamyl/glutaminyl-tRNA synthetase class Ib catalytic domain-containing protein n=1 Tax=Angustibacter aerolatus TaxID=1162965 RepID=A0ABQ6JQ11_9ACTN|nr:hypothetical protein GCM10025868_40110 [Angustibacter aerolatus]